MVSAFMIIQGGLVLWCAVYTPLRIGNYVCLGVPLGLVPVI